MPVFKSAFACCTVNVGAKVLVLIEIVDNVWKIYRSLTRPPDTYIKLQNGTIVETRYSKYSFDSPSVVLPVALVIIVASMLLLVGLVKQNKSMLTHYLIVKGIYAAVIIGFMLNYALFYNEKTWILTEIYMAIVLGNQFFFWIWVFSVYQQMQELDSNAAENVNTQMLELVTQ